MSQQLSLAAALEASRARLAGVVVGTPTTSSSPYRPGFSHPGVASEGGLRVGSHGEFSLSGGGSTGLPVFLMTDAMISSLCLGSVSGGVKFCCVGRDSCSFAAHSKKVTVVRDHVYISGGGSRASAYTSHHLDSSKVSQVRMSELLREMHPLDDWIRLFHSVESLDDAIDVAQVDEVVDRALAQVPIGLTPRKRKQRYDDFDDEDPMESRVFTPIMELPDEDDQVSRLLAQWDHYTTLVKRLEAAVRNTKRDIGEDVDVLELKVESVAARVGTDPGVAESRCATVWDGIACIASRVEDVEKSKADQKQLVDLEEVMTSQRESTRAIVAELKATQDQVTALIHSLVAEQEALHAKFASLSSTGWSLQEKQELANLGDRLGLLEARSLGESGLERDDFARAELRKVWEQLKLIEARVSTTPVRFGGMAFLSLPDVATFVLENVPSNVYYLFHDAVSLLESISESFVARGDVLDDIYKGQKVGFGSEAEARLVASFRLTIPTVFGQIKDGAVSKHNLPALKNYSVWNSHDNISGVKYYIERGIDDQRLILVQDIDTYLSDHPKARSLANDLQQASHSFVADLSSWIDSFVQELTTTSEASLEEAWALTTSCVKKIFEEIRKARAAAANAYAEKDAVQRCAKYLWATLQAQQIMKSFSDQRF